MERNGDEILIVDLDGTLLQTDSLHESYWSAWSHDWRTPLLAIFALLHGRCALKEFLHSTSGIDVKALPYNEEVVAFVREWRLKGGRAALVTGAYQGLADSIAGHLGIFDEVHGTDVTRNLTGKVKADFILKRFPGEVITYMGDAKTDLAVWSHVSKVITVNATKGVRRQTESLGKELEHIFTDFASIKGYIEALRPHQWLKNLLVFLPLIAAHQFAWSQWQQSFFAFIAFTLLASSVYVTNDLLDLQVDRNHPRKKYRPFASGRIPIHHGFLLAVLLLLSGFALALQLNGALAWVLLIYWLLASSYSLVLKRKVIVDICILSSFYTLRIFAGGVSNQIHISFWLIGFCAFFFLSVAAVKRQAELVDLKWRNKFDSPGRGYVIGDLPVLVAIGLGAAFLAAVILGLYLNSETVTRMYASPLYLWGSWFVIVYWLSRMVLLTHRGKMHDDPVAFALTDGVSLLSLLLICLFAILAAI